MQIDLTVMGFAVLACLIFIIVKQMRTIDKLTDKILGIQVTKEKPTIKEDDVSPMKEDEPIGYWDK